MSSIVGLELTIDFRTILAVSLAFKRLDGPDPRGPIYFLPMGLSFDCAVRWGLIAISEWRACYELSGMVLHPNPEICLSSLKQIEQDVFRSVSTHGRPDLLVGFSMGTVPATALASRFGARPWSFASADRGELMIWSSPKAHDLRARAERMGYGQDDFARALCAINPINCIDSINPASRLVFGAFDRYIPRARRLQLAEKASHRFRPKNIVILPFGHVGVILASRWLQRRWARLDAIA